MSAKLRPHVKATICSAASAVGLLHVSGDGTFQDAIEALNTFQTNFAVLEQRRQDGHKMGQNGGPGNETLAKENRPCSSTVLRKRLHIYCLDRADIPTSRSILTISVLSMLHMSTRSSPITDLHSGHQVRPGYTPHPILSPSREDNDQSQPVSE